MSNLLPILDLSGYHTLQPPGKPFFVLDPPSDAQEPSGAQDAPLHQLLGIPALLKQVLATQSQTPAKEGVPYVREFKQLIAPVGKTSQGAIVAVALHFVVRGQHYIYQWSAYNLPAQALRGFAESDPSSDPNNP
jgi:hypothetical protein